MTVSALAPTRTRTTFVAPALTDFDLGVVAFKTGRNLSSCTSDDMRQGWNWAGEDCYLRAMMADARYVPAVKSDLMFVGAN